MSDQAFDLALVVTLARPAEAVLEQVMACMGIFKSRGDFDHCAPFLFCRFLMRSSTNGSRSTVRDKQ
jgi:hypothetical protein